MNTNNYIPTKNDTLQAFLIRQKARKDGIKGKTTTKHLGKVN